MLVVVAMLMLQHGTATDGGGNGISKDGCQEKCGNVSILYPFGIGGKGCFREGFEVKCTLNGDAQLAGSSNVTLLEINLTLSEARVQNRIGWQCNDSTGHDAGSPDFFVGSSFTVSRAKNSSQQSAVLPLHLSARVVAAMATTTPLSSLAHVDLSATRTTLIMAQSALAGVVASLQYQEA